MFVVSTPDKARDRILREVVGLVLVVVIKAVWLCGCGSPLCGLGDNNRNSPLTTASKYGNTQPPFFILSYDSLHSPVVANNVQSTRSAIFLQVRLNEMH